MATYRGQCHCGAVSYNVTTEIGEVMECNCSICRRVGWKMAFVDADQFELLSGSDALEDYQFGRKHIHHAFCRTCGVRSYGWGGTESGDTMYMINVRCLDDFDFADLPVNAYDGASL